MGGIGPRLARSLVRALGWQLEGSPPDVPRYVLVGAPHTSNADLTLALLVSVAMGIRLHWLGKDSLFRPPLGVLLRAVGGIPVERGSRSGTVERMAARIRERDRFVLGISPEGTRGIARHWSTGFYHIAVAAGVPIVLGFADYDKRIAGIGPTVYPTGDIDADFVAIASFYRSMRGKHPERQAAPTLLRNG